MSSNLFCRYLWKTMSRRTIHQHKHQHLLLRILILMNFILKKAQIRNVQEKKFKLRTKIYVKVKELLKKVKNKFKYKWGKLKYEVQSLFKTYEYVGEDDTTNHKEMLIKGKNDQETFIQDYKAWRNNESRLFDDDTQSSRQRRPKT